MVSMGHDYARKVSAKWVEKMVSIPTRFCRITSNLSDFLLCTNRIYYLHILHGFLGSSSMKSEKFTHSLKDALLELWVSLCSSQTLAAGVYSHKGIPTSRRSKGSDCRLIECPTMTKGSNAVPGQRSRAAFPHVPALGGVTQYMGRYQCGKITSPAPSHFPPLPEMQCECTVEA